METSQLLRAGCRDRLRRIAGSAFGLGGAVEVEVEVEG
jgi:hypothetical protein